MADYSAADRLASRLRPVAPELVVSPGLDVLTDLALDLNLPISDIVARQSVSDLLAEVEDGDVVRAQLRNLPMAAVAQPHSVTTSLCANAGEITARLRSVDDEVIAIITTGHDPINQTLDEVCAPPRSLRARETDDVS